MNFEHLMQKVRDAANGGINAMSTGEALSVALVLNRPDWLKSMGYTIAEALDRIDLDTIGLLRRAERQWLEECSEEKYRKIQEAQAEVETEVFTAVSSDIQLELRGELVTYGNAPGYRDVDLVFDVRPLVGDDDKVRRLSVRVRPEDAESIVKELLSVHRHAWLTGHGPLDRRDGETKPTWIERKL